MKDKAEILAKKYGTPLFVIDLDKLKENFLRFKRAFPNSIVAYSYKTNFHPEILKELNKFGAFAEIISAQELYFAEKVGVKKDKIIFNGVGRTNQDFLNAISKNIFSINLNSIDELEKISTLSKKLQKIVEIGLRIDLEIDLEHRKSFTKSKFGIKIRDYEKAKNIIKGNQYLKLKVLHSHIGTNLVHPESYIENFKILSRLSKNRDIYLDLGGGFASESILKENKKSIFDFSKAISKINQYKYKLIFEPGRYLVEDSCYCVTKVLSVYHNWVILDIAGNFLIPLANANYRVKRNNGKQVYNFAGNLCFAADIIQKGASSPKLNEGDIIQINNVGAYTFSLRNNMAFPDPIIVTKRNNKFKLYKRRQTLSKIFKDIH